MSEMLALWQSVVILMAALVVMNLGLTIINFKLYTEIMKEKSQRERVASSADKDPKP